MIRCAPKDLYITMSIEHDGKFQTYMYISNAIYIFCYTMHLLKSHVMENVITREIPQNIELHEKNKIIKDHKWHMLLYTYIC